MPAAAPPTAPGRILATVTAAQVLSVASITVVAVALPSLARDLDVGGSEQQWVIDAFVLVFASLLVAGGVLGDRWGRRSAMLAGLALFGLGSAWCAVAPDIGWLLAGRVVQALGPALVLPASLAIVTSAYVDPAARARAVGLWGAGSGAGLTLGPLLGGGVVSLAGWRWVFGAIAALVVVLAALAWRLVPRDSPAPATARFDALAAMLLTAGVAAATFVLIEGRTLGWRSPAVVGLVVLTAGLVAAFVIRERRHPAPLIDLGLLRRPSFLAANLGGAVLFGIVTGLTVYLSIFLQQLQGRSAFQAGLCLLPFGLLTAACAPLAGRATARVGPRPPLLAGLAFVCAGVLLLLRVEPDTPAVELIAGLTLLGAGTGVALPAATIVALASAPAAQAGMASAVHQTCRQLGQTFGVAALGTVIFAAAGDVSGGERLTGAAADSWVDGLHGALVLSATALLLAILVLRWLLPRRSIVRTPG